MGTVLLMFTTVVCLTRPWKSSTLCYVDALSSVMLIILLFFGYSTLFCGEKIRNLRLDGENKRALGWEIFIEMFTSGMVYSNALIFFGIAVLLARMTNQLRPSVQAQKQAREKLAMKDLCEVVLALCIHDQFEAALRRTVEVANDDDIAAIKGFISSVVHKLDDESLVARMDDSLGASDRISRHSTLERSGMGLVSSVVKGRALMRQQTRELTERREDERREDERREDERTSTHERTEAWEENHPVTPPSE